MDYVEFSEQVSLLQDNLKILDVMPKSVNLKQDGELYIGRCPFHKDAGKSLIVNPAAGKFYCSVCHAGGGVLQFIALTKKASLKETIESQAESFGVKLYVPRKNFDDEKISRRRAVTEINDYAKNFYHEILTLTDDGEICRKYLESRGINNAAIEKFQLGFAPNVERKLVTFLNDYDFEFKLMFDVGLIEEKNNSLFDKFRDCVIIPLLDNSRHTKAIVGRVFNFEKKSYYETDGIDGKFIYPAESITFNKSKLIFGFSAAQEFIVKSKRVLIVDDCLDAITLNCAGIENVVAIFENFFTSEHAEFLMKYAEEIIFCIKNEDELQIDEETLRILELENKKIFVVALPKNPAEFLIENGREIFLKHLENPVQFLEYKSAKKIGSDAVPVRQFDLSEQIIKIPMIRQKGEAILRGAWHDIGFLKYVLEIFPRKIFQQLHQEMFEYLQICAAENKRPSKESAEIYLDDEFDENFIDRLAGKITPLDRIEIEDAVESLLRSMKNINYSEHKIEVAEDNAKSKEKLRNLQEYFEHNE